MPGMLQQQKKSNPAAKPTGLPGKSSAIHLRYLRQMHLHQHLIDSVRMRISTEINRNCFYLHLQLSLPLMPHVCLMKRSFITTMFTHTFSVSLMMMENLH